MSASAQNGFLDSEETIDLFLHAFFHRTLPKAQWTHAAHVTLAASLLHSAEVATVLPQVRNAIRSYNEAVGTRNTDTSGYHETLTVFWLRVVAQKLRRLHPSSRLEAVRAVVDAFGEQRALHKLYYSTDIVANTAARRVWVEPDLQPLP
jgi:hypothetical protein